MWFARSTKLAWDLSSLYAPAGGAALGAIGGGAADSVARDIPLCKPSVAANSAPARRRNLAGFVRFAQIQLCTGEALKWMSSAAFSLHVTDQLFCDFVLHRDVHGKSMPGRDPMLPAAIVRFRDLGFPFAFH